jgi:hypothetical protein
MAVMHRRTRRWWDLSYEDACKASDAKRSDAPWFGRFVQAAHVPAPPVAAPVDPAIFERHRDSCADHCGKSPYTLCDVGYELLRAEDASNPRQPFRPWSTKQLAVYVGHLLRSKCRHCGAALIKNHHWGLNIVCPARLGDDRDEAVKHDCHPIDTGPFSLGRRVD